MGIEQELDNRLKEAMRAKSSRDLIVLRMIKTEAQVQRTAPGFDGDTGDAFWTGVITRYVKQQKKALEEFRAAGDSGREGVEQLEYEIAYLAPFLPKLLDEAAVRALVKEAIRETGAVGGKMLGKVVGHIMKSHRESVDAAVVKKIAAEELG